MDCAAFLNYEQIIIHICPYLVFIFTTFSGVTWICRSQWPRGLRLVSVSARLLGLWVRTPSEARMSVACVCWIVRDRPLRRSDHSSGSPTSVTCLCVTSKPQQWGLGLLRLPSYEENLNLIILVLFSFLKASVAIHCDTDQINKYRHFPWKEVYLFILAWNYISFIQHVGRRSLMLQRQSKRMGSSSLDSRSYAITNETNKWREWIVGNTDEKQSALYECLRYGKSYCELKCNMTAVKSGSQNPWAERYFKAALFNKCKC